MNYNKDFVLRSINWDDFVQIQNSVNINITPYFIDSVSMVKHVVPIDNRIIEPNGFDEAMLLVITEEPTETVMLSCFLIEMKVETLKNVFFWYKKVKTLNRITLYSLIKESEARYYKSFITIGFTAANPNKLVSFSVVKPIIEAIRMIIDIPNVFKWIEPMGEYLFDININKKNKIEIEKLNSQYPFLHIGKTREESMVAEKIGIKYGLQKQSGLYNMYTLGPVYCSNSLV